MSIKENIKFINNKIEEASIRCGRNPKEITLIAVSKTVSSLEVKEAYTENIIDFAENKSKELSKKVNEFSEDVNWHFIGHLQTNKVKEVVEKVSLIHSVDSVNLAKEIQRVSKNKNIVTNILIQINISNELTKFGIDKEEVFSFLKEIENFENIKVKGLMTIAPNTENKEFLRNIFKELKAIYDEIKLKYKNVGNIDFEYLSMGMSNDFEIAIEEGSNMIRVGSSIFKKNEEGDN